MDEAYLVPTYAVDGAFALKSEMVRVGSSPVCDIVVDNPTVSRLHSKFRKVAESWLVEDMGSRNGTWVNGRCIRAPTTIAGGDHISLGSARFFFEDGRQAVRLEDPEKAIQPGGGPLERVIALRPYDFEKLTGELFTKLGFEAIVTKQSSDGGVDVEAINSGVIFRGKYLIQCKRYRPGNKVSRPEIQGFFGRIASEPGTKGIFVTSSTFTKGAYEFAQSTGINLIDGEDLQRLVVKFKLL